MRPRNFLMAAILGLSVSLLPLQAGEVGPAKTLPKPIDPPGSGFPVRVKPMPMPKLPNCGGVRMPVVPKPWPKLPTGGGIRKAN